MEQDRATVVEPNYFVVNRKLIHSDFWLSEPFSKPQAWIDMIALARYSSGEVTLKNIVKTLQRGQLAWSVKGLAERWRWSRGKVTRFIAQLVAEGRITRDGDDVNLVLTIVNYDRFQKRNKTERKRTPNGTKTDTETDTETDTPKLDAKPETPTVCDDTKDVDGHPNGHLDGTETERKRNENGHERNKEKEIKEGEVQLQPQTHNHDGRLPSKLASHAQSGELHKLFFGWVEMVAQSEFRPMQPLRIDMILTELSNRAKSVPDAIEIVQRSIRKNATRDLYYEDLKFQVAETNAPPELTQPKIKKFFSGIDKVER